MSIFIPLFSALALLASIESVTAHMALWHPSMYGFAEPYEPCTPLAGLSFDKWWFHGYTADTPAEVMTITAGQPLTVEIACRKAHSTYGDAPSADGCPIDSGAFHAGGESFVKNGWEGNSEADLMGCALAIAPTKNAASTEPEDFTVMSIQENCVRQRDTTFAIPANLPECPNGECTCAWFWQGKISAPQMYMIGFRCKVVGGVATPFPKPAEPRRNAISGSTQPMYWANDMSNIGYTPVYDADRPSYNSKFGWADGAQTSAFGAGDAGGEGGEQGGDDDVPDPTSAIPTPSTIPTTVPDIGDNDDSPAPIPTSALPTEDGENQPSVSAVPNSTSTSTTAVPDPVNDDEQPAPAASAISTRTRRRPRPTHWNNHAAPVPTTTAITAAPGATGSTSVCAGGPKKRSRKHRVHA